MEHVPQSPYLRAVGGHRIQLHPALRTYFAAVPRGRAEISEGVFERIGTPRRWLWPLLRPLQRHGVAHAGWHENVPFTMHSVNVAGRAVSERTLHLPHSEWKMRDATSAGSRGRVLSQLGEPVTLAIVFDVSVDGDALALRSRSVGIRICRFRVRLPRLVAPVVKLRESAEKQVGRQRVSLTVDLPLIGRIYEYQVVFSYAIDDSE